MVSSRALEMHDSVGELFDLMTVNAKRFFNTSTALLIEWREKWCSP